MSGTSNSLARKCEYRLNGFRFNRANTLENCRELSLFLLDNYSGSIGGYSFRQLSSTATNVVRVRRSSDNTEQDFNAAEVTDGTLTTFTGANDGFVVTWYDQSGTGSNATQSTAGNQPKLVAAGSLLTDGDGNAAMDFVLGGTACRLETSPTLATGEYTFFSVMDTNNTVNYVTQGLLNVSTAVNQTFGSVYDGGWKGSQIGASVPTLYTFLLGATTFDTRADAVTADDDIAYTRGSGILKIGGSGSGGQSDRFSEFILYATIRADFADIETSINNHYSLY